MTLYHPKCKGQDYIGSTGWGYGNKKQIEETVTIKNNIKADKTTFYYDDNILISWVFDLDFPDKCKEVGISNLVAFANINENFISGSLEAADSIIKSLEFMPLKATVCQ